MGIAIGMAVLTAASGVGFAADVVTGWNAAALDAIRAAGFLTRAKKIPVRRAEGGLASSSADCVAAAPWYSHHSGGRTMVFAP
jgi:hypothetical protein